MDTSAFSYVISRLREPSTWVGLGSLLTGLGIAIAPEYWDAITSVGLSVGGLIAVLVSEKSA